MADTHNSFDMSTISGQHLAIVAQWPFVNVAFDLRNVAGQLNQSTVNKLGNLRARVYYYREF